MTGTGVVRTEDVVRLCEVVAVGTGDGCMVVLECHIVDEDSVPDITIQRSTPRGNDGWHVIHCLKMSYRCQQTC